MSVYPYVLKAAKPGRCCHCNLPIVAGEPISRVYDYCSVAHWPGWEHVDHHPRTWAAADAWGLLDDEGDRE